MCSSRARTSEVILYVTVLIQWRHCHRAIGAFLARPSRPLVPVRLGPDQTDTMRETLFFFFLPQSQFHPKSLRRCPARGLLPTSGRGIRRFHDQNLSLRGRCEGSQDTEYPPQHPRRNRPSLYVVLVIRFHGRLLNVDAVKHYGFHHHIVLVEFVALPGPRHLFGIVERGAER